MEELSSAIDTLSNQLDTVQGDARRDIEAQLVDLRGERDSLEYSLGDEVEGLRGYRGGPA